MNRRLDDAELDELLLMASQALESAMEEAQPGTSKDCFSSPVSSTKVQEVRKQGVPKRTPSTAICCEASRIKSSCSAVVTNSIPANGPDLPHSYFLT